MENREVLLQKVYHESCPGCKVNQHKEIQKGVPYKDLCLVAVIVLCAALPISILFPFLYFMIRDFHIAKREEDIGYYAGYVGSSYHFGRALTSYLWGIVADRYGRKPVITFGSLTLVVLNILFGLSTNFWMAFSTRLLLGCLCGIYAPLMAYVSEICREEHMTLGMSLLYTVWALGLVIGPSLGGFLAQPAEKYPYVFSEASLFGRFPYFLPCLCVSVFGAAGTVASFWLQETYHIHNGEKKELHVEEESEKINMKGPNLKENLLKNWPLMSAIITYSVFSLHDMAYSEIFSLWAVSPRKHGGLSYTTDDVGVVLSLSGLGLLLSQMFLYPVAARILGETMVTRIAAALSIPLLASYPFIAMLSGFSLSLVINVASALNNIFAMFVDIGLIILQNKAVAQHQRGASNGIVMTAMSFFKGFGPAGGGAIFSLAQKRQEASFLPGDHLVFFVLNVIEAIGLLMMFKPFLAEPVSKTN